MNILVTGGAGFIGSHLVRHYQGRAHIRVLDSLRTGSGKNLEGLDVEFLKGSILDDALLEKAMRGIDHVFHMAALVSVPESMEKIEECEEINVLGLLKTLRAAEKAGVQKLVLASSAAVYGDNPDVPKRESMLPEPRSPYAITKLAGEFYCDLFQRTTRLKTASLRFFNVFGPYQDPGSAYAAAVPIFIRKALLCEPLEIHGDGSQTRDFISVRDIVAALAFVAENPSASGVFNVGYGVSTSIRSMAEEIISLCGSSSRLTFGPERPGDVRHSLAGVEKITEAGFRPLCGLKEGLAETISHFRENTPGM